MLPSPVFPAGSGMPGSTVSSARHLKTGRDGEDRAVAALLARGYRLLERNWRCSAGELDAVMSDDTELVFVEVKTRVGVAMGSAEEALTASKARKLVATAEWYLAEHPELDDPIWRIDLVAVTLDTAGNPVRFSHIRNAAVIG